MHAGDLADLFQGRTDLLLADIDREAAVKHLLSETVEGHGEA
jgi:uncharacterized protein (DUF952 family)